LNLNPFDITPLTFSFNFDAASFEHEIEEFLSFYLSKTSKKLARFFFFSLFAAFLLFWGYLFPFHHTQAHRLWNWYLLKCFDVKTITETFLMATKQEEEFKS